MERRIHTRTRRTDRLLVYVERNRGAIWPEYLLQIRFGEPRGTSHEPEGRANRTGSTGLPSGNLNGSNIYVGGAKARGQPSGAGLIRRQLTGSIQFRRRRLSP